MPVRGAKLAGLVETAVDVVHDRAPGFSEKAYRNVAVPLMMADPAGAARSVEARLDGTRDRVAQMAAKGSVPPAGARRVRRDLARTRADVECLSPRLPVVQARSLAQRSAAYSETLQTLAHPTVTSGGAARGAVVLVGALAAWVGLLLILTGVVTAVLVGVVAGVITASAITNAGARRDGRVRLSALADALLRADLALPSSNLDQKRHALLERARKSGRLDARGRDTLKSIDAHLNDLLVRLLEDELEADAAHLVQATVERYLPDTLEPFLAMSNAQARVRERPAAVEVADQLASIDTALAELVRRPSRVNLEQQLLRQGEFLRSKFGA